MPAMTRAVALLGVLILVGCDQPQETAETPASATAAVDAAGPCSLLSAEEVSAVIGPLAGAPYRAGGMQPHVEGDSCRYEAADLRSLVVSVVWADGARSISVMNMMQGIIQGVIKDSKAGVITLINGTTLTGEWDEARIMGCCEFNALRGDQLVSIDFSGTRAELTQGVTLVNAAILRLDKPLVVDDTAAVAAALTRESTRPKLRSVCELLPRADAEALTQKTLLEAPVGNDTRCLYRIPLGMPDSSLDLTLNVQWRDGFREFTIMQNAFGQSLDLIDLDHAPVAQEPGPWDVYAESIVGVAAVKRDVLVSVDSGPFMQDVARAFVEKAVENLGK